MEVIDLTDSPPSTPLSHEKTSRTTSDMEKLLKLKLYGMSNFAEFGDLNLPSEPAEPKEDDHPMLPQILTDQQTQNQCESDMMLLDNSMHAVQQGVDQSALLNNKNKNKRKYTFFYTRGRLPKDLWSEREHELFLMGLVRYGKGHWTKIARHFVGTKTPQQVSAYALAFYKRLPITYLYAFKRKGTTVDYIQNGVPNAASVTQTTLIRTPNFPHLPPEPAQNPNYEPPQTLMLFPVEAPLFPVPDQQNGHGDISSSSSSSAAVLADAYSAMEGCTLDLTSMDDSSELDLDLRLG